MKIGAAEMEVGEVSAQASRSGRRRVDLGIVGRIRQVRGSVEPAD